MEIPERQKRQKLGRGFGEFKTDCAQMLEDPGDFPGGAVVQNRLPMQGTRVQGLVREDPTCCRATKPVSHNY